MIRFSVVSCRLLLPLVVAAAVLLAGPPRAQAQCESPAQPPQAQAAAIAAQSAAVTAMTTQIVSAAETATTVSRSAINTGMETSWKALLDRLNKYWEDQQAALKGQAAQEHAGKLEESRQLAALADAATLSTAARAAKKAEYDARKLYLPTEEGCRFDTTATYLSAAMGVRRSVSSAATNNLVADLTGREGKSAARGGAADNAARAVRARGQFCDPANNAGAAGCLADGGAFADAHVLPSRTLIGSDTYDLSDPRMLQALNDLSRNIVGYRVPNDVDPALLETAEGLEYRQRLREATAQFDALLGMVWSIAGERMPAGAAPEVVEMRLRTGTAQPAREPSEYEIRRQAVEQLWDPAYYVNLQDTSSATRQKQVYLRAYSVMQMYRLLEKMEQVSVAYAIQTGTLLDSRAREGMSGATGTGQ